MRVGLDTAITNVRRVAEAELSDDVAVELPEGHTVTLQNLPVRRAGVYVPGGRAAYPSSVVMCCVPARVAGVSEIAVATPPGPDGRPSAAVLAACRLCGVEVVYLMGGAQAVAALAYGTDSVAPVDVIVGPGQLLRAGGEAPGSWGWSASTASPGPPSCWWLPTRTPTRSWSRSTSPPRPSTAPTAWSRWPARTTPLLEAVADAATRLAAERPTVQDAPLALVRTPSIEAAIEFANAFAPEHLELACEDAARARGIGARQRLRLHRGGAAFGDYAAGSNHVLPTGGAARFSGPLGATTFRRRQALVSLPESAARALAPHVSSVARAEGFPVHAESAEARAGSPAAPATTT